MDSSPIEEVLGIQPKNMATIRTSEMQLRSREQKGGHDSDEQRPPRPEAVYRLVVGETSPSLAVEVDEAGEHYREPSSISKRPTVHEQ